MKFEVIAYFQNRENSVSLVDKERSVPAREITHEEEGAFKSLFEAAGYRKRETGSQVFYTAVEDARHSTEYIFYK